MNTTEKLTSAAHSASFLTSDLREAHSALCQTDTPESRLAEMIVRDMLCDATDLERRIKEVIAAMGGAK